MLLCKSRGLILQLVFSLFLMICLCFSAVKYEASLPHFTGKMSNTLTEKSWRLLVTYITRIIWSWSCVATWYYVYFSDFVLTSFQRNNIVPITRGTTYDSLKVLDGLTKFYRVLLIAQIISDGKPSCHLDMLDKLQKWICRTVGPTLVASAEPLGHCRNIASLSFFCRYFLVYFHLNWLNWFCLLNLLGVLLVVLIDCMIFLSPFLDVVRLSMSTASFLPQLDFGIIYLLNGFLWS